MSHYLLSRIIKQTFRPKFHPIVINCTFTSSTILQNSNKERYRYIKYFAIALGGTITLSFAYKVYKWTVQVPTCPNYHRNQNININNVLECTALVRNLDKQCSGTSSMNKIGAATGVNFKLVQSKSENIDSSTKVLLNDNDIIQRNIFDNEYILDYFETLVDLILKLDEIHCTRLLSNLIGYYIFICPECHSSITRQMISCTSYLNKVGLRANAVDISEIVSEKGDN
jgi:hypothetical protein